MNYLTILRMAIFQNWNCGFFTVSDPYFPHFGILTKRKNPHSVQARLFIKRYHPLCLSCSVCCVAQLKYWDCVLSCSQTTEVSEQSFPPTPEGALLHDKSWELQETIAKHVHLGTASNGSQEWSQGLILFLVVLNAKPALNYQTQDKITSVLMLLHKSLEDPGLKSSDPIELSVNSCFMYLFLP